VAFLLCFNDEN